MRSGRQGPRQPGGGRQTAGPRDRDRNTRPFGKAAGKGPVKPRFEDKPRGEGRARFDDRPRFEDKDAAPRRGRAGKPAGERSFERKSEWASDAVWDGPRFDDDGFEAPRGRRPGRAASPPRGEERGEAPFAKPGRAKAAGAKFGGSKFGGARAGAAKSGAGTSGSAKSGSGKPRTAKPGFDTPRPVRAAASRPIKPVPEPVAVQPITTSVQVIGVKPDEAGMRLDRFIEAKFPGLSFAHIQRIVRKGEVRLDGKRADGKDRIAAGQQVRLPPLSLAPPPQRDSEAAAKARATLAPLVLFEDADVMVINKPFGLAVQGGSGMTRHVDGLLMALADARGERPRLVHRLDRDTTGCLVIAKTRKAASELTKSFRARGARKIYWALVKGVPKPKQGRVSTFVARGEGEESERMRVARHGEEGASHAVSYYAVVETAGQQLSWLSMKPVTGRTHQLRLHAATIGHPIVGDPKYFEVENWDLPGGMQNRLHLHARRIVIPHPRGGTIDVTAPLPDHMAQSWNLLGFDAKRYDPIEEAPEE
jgi:23S rRNA pseudouridine955/2504/2580 synthase